MPQPLEDQRTTVYKVDPEHPANPSLPTLRTEEMMLNMGPQHPSTHGVLKVVLALEGERIVKATPVMGFLHRGVEKLAEDGTYHQLLHAPVQKRSEEHTSELQSLRHLVCRLLLE